LRVSARREGGSVERAGDALRRQRRISLNRRRVLGELIDDREHTEASPPIEHIVHEVDRPTLVGSHRSGEWFAAQEGDAFPYAFAHL
jgi:hypothetical protein